MGWKKREQSLRDMWCYNKRSNFRDIGVLEGEEKRAELKKCSLSNGLKLSEFGKKHKAADLRSQANLKQDKPKEIHGKAHQLGNSNF